MVVSHGGHYYNTVVTYGECCHCDGKFPSKCWWKWENLEKNWKNLEKLTSGSQNPTFKSGKNRIFSGKVREKSGKNDLKILYQPWSTRMHVGNVGKLKM